MNRKTIKAIIAVTVIASLLFLKIPTPVQAQETYIPIEPASAGQLIDDVAQTLFAGIMTAGGIHFDHVDDMLNTMGQILDGPFQASHFLDIARHQVNFARGYARLGMDTVQGLWNAGRDFFASRGVDETTPTGPVHIPEQQVFVHGLYRGVPVLNDAILTKSASERRNILSNLSINATIFENSQTHVETGQIRHYAPMQRLEAFFYVNNQRWQHHVRNHLTGGQIVANIIDHGLFIIQRTEFTGTLMRGVSYHHGWATSLTPSTWISPTIRDIVFFSPQAQPPPAPAINITTHNHNIINNITNTTNHINNISGAPENNNEILIRIDMNVQELINRTPEQIIIHHDDQDPEPTPSPSPSPPPGNGNDGDNDNGWTWPGLPDWLPSLPDWLPGLPSFPSLPSLPSIPGLNGLLEMVRDGIVGAIGALSNVISGLLDNIFGVLNNILSTLGGIATTIIDALRDLFLFLFVPGEDFFQSNFDTLSDRLRERLPYQTYLDTFGQLRNIQIALSEPITPAEMNYASITPLATPDATNWDLNNHQQYISTITTIIRPFLTSARTVVGGLYVILFSLWNVKQMLWLLRGSTPSGGTTVSVVNDS